MFSDQGSDDPDTEDDEPGPWELSVDHNDPRDYWDDVESTFELEAEAADSGEQEIDSEEPDE